MNQDMADVGVMSGYELDLAFGSDENNFECTIPSNQHCCEAGYYLYIDGTEYGGIIDALEVRTESNEMVYTGRTWHGILGSRIIMPLTSSDRSKQGVTVKTSDSTGSLVNKYLIISGDANKCIGFILERIGLTALFEASEESSGTISSFKFDRFINGYDGLMKMLASAGMKLGFKYENSKVVVSAIEKHDYSTDEEFDPSMVEIQLKKKVNSVNHLICLGGGELENRTVLHLYTDAEGNISTVQTQTGMKEYADIYDFSNVESDEELLKSGKEQLKKLWEPDNIDIKMDDSSDFYGVGDIVGATDAVTGMSGSAAIQKKIVHIANNIVSISYEVGE